MEDLKKPTVVLCNDYFLNDARSTALVKGMPSLRIVPEKVPTACEVIEEIEAGISAVVDKIVSALTEPRTSEEENPTSKAKERLPRIQFAGNLEEVNRFFYRRGWTDGLPIIPPTEEAVAEMLTGTDLPPDHEVTKLIPRLGKATLEKIAVNAVMAGALPTYMPILIACVQALMEPEAKFGTYGVSTGSWAPLWIINGPVRNALLINSRSGALSPGDMANAAIGRAMALIIKNIGGIRRGNEDTGVLGNPNKYTMVIAENEEESPWEPMHTEAGLKKEDSSVTVFFPNSHTQYSAYTTEPKGILGTVIYNINRPGLTCLILNPTHSRILAESGWKKKDIKDFITENARIPYYLHPESRGYYPNGIAPKLTPQDPYDSVSLFSSRDQLKIVVAGGVGNLLGLHKGGESAGGGYRSKFVTKKIELPTHWDKLVTKYKSIVPTLISY